MKHYFWFVKESQSFMKGHNKMIVFLKSLIMGITFARKMKEYEQSGFKE